MVAITLTKPAIEYTGEERQLLYRDLFRAIRAGLTPNCPGNKCSGKQIDYAKGRAMRLMMDAGF
jgi:hypothetical protein